MPIGASKAVIFGTNTFNAGEPPGSFRMSDNTACQISSTFSGGSNISPDFSTLSYQTFAFSVWIKNPAATGTEMPVFIVFSSLDLSVSEDKVKSSVLWAGAGVKTLDLPVSIPIDDSWHHLYYRFDATQATFADQHSIYLDGSLVGAYDASIHCNTGDTVSSSDPSWAWENRAIHYISGSNIEGVSIYQPALFSGTLPDVGDLYDAGSPTDISALPGLFSYIDTSINYTFDDAMLDLTWAYLNIERDSDRPV